MSTLTEIETATERLSSAEKQKLLLFLATQLRGETAKLPEPRKFAREQMPAWRVEDEAELQRFRHDA